MQMVTLGPLGTFSHQAAMIAAERLQDEYGHINLKYRATNREVLEATAYGKCLGLVPIGNSRAGLVSGVVIDFWLKKKEGAKVFVIGEIKLPIAHQLLVRPGVRLRQVQTVISHPQALAQCEKHLDTLKIRTRIEATSTAEAARLVSASRKMLKTAALASELAGEIYRLENRRPNMQDSKGNFTRFHILGPTPAHKDGFSRTALIFRTPNTPGALAKVVDAIGAEGANISSVRQISPEDAPESAFFCEFDGHRDGNSGRRIIRQMYSVGRVTILGSFPKPTN